VEIINIVNKNKNEILLTIFIGLLLGTIYYYLPKNYYTSGTLYITRKVEQNSAEYFKYEGYYGQQAAISFTENVISVLESTDIQSKTLSEMKNEVTKVNLLKLKRNVTIKKSSPQVITITTKDATSKRSNEIWNNIVNISIKNIEEINNASGDPYLKITKIGEPLTTQNYYPLYICAIVGAGISFFVYLSLVVLKSYQYEKKEKN